ncbi:GNAT family N-acetyltransferase [Bordetella avium]|uniref:GNAT family N-acetyltransferase n=1 Tax=Bordetella avium TaxID=521 RepID=UPI000E6836FD|nr:GNAT family N-acetyltransferase [Bordetella avium]RIQ72003.1 GNAT family N-acetyltransferase [Bordetella avium]
MSSACIRPLGPESAASFQALRLAALCDTPDAFGSSYEEEQRLTTQEWAGRITPTSASLVLGAWEAEQLVGCAGLYRLSPLKQQHKAVIWGVYVAPAQRGAGLGRQLILSAIDHARQWQGLRQLLLTVNSSKLAACQLYRSLGFKAYGHEPAALYIDGRPIDETLMLKLLDD